MDERGRKYFIGDEEHIQCNRCYYEYESDLSSCPTCGYPEIDREISRYREALIEIEGIIQEMKLGDTQETFLHLMELLSIVNGALDDKEEVEDEV